jgi:flagellar basal-body rod modification protein FlgD
MFLQLLCTQVQTQNPLDPMDSTEFTQQLATYAGLEQQIASNDKLDAVVSSLNSLSLSSGVGYLGHTVEASTDTLSVSADGAADASWRYSLDSDASAVALTIVDEDGNTVWSGDGETASGGHTFSWDGKDSNGNAVAAGDYTLQVAATNSAGAEVTSSISIRGTVTAVDSSSGSAVVELGDTQIDLSDVTRLAA